MPPDDPNLNPRNLAAVPAYQTAGASAPILLDDVWVLPHVLRVLRLPTHHGLRAPSVEVVLQLLQTPERVVCIRRRARQDPGYSVDVRFENRTHKLYLHPTAPAQLVEGKAPWSLRVWVDDFARKPHASDHDAAIPKRVTTMPTSFQDVEDMWDAVQEGVMRMPPKRWGL